MRNTLFHFCQLWAVNLDLHSNVWNLIMILKSWFQWCSACGRGRSHVPGAPSVKNTRCVSSIKNDLKLINSTHVFEPNTLEKPSPLSADCSWILTDWSTSGSMASGANFTSCSRYYNLKLMPLADSNLSFLFKIKKRYNHVHILSIKIISWRKNNILFYCHCYRPLFLTGKNKFHIESKCLDWAVHII